MTKAECTFLSQLVGGIKRARSSTLSAAGQIDALRGRIAGTPEEMLLSAGVKSLLQGKCWMDQAVETLELAVRRHRDGT